MAEPAQPELTNDDRMKIRLEEEYRAAVRKDLQDTSHREGPKSAIWVFVNSSFGLWLLSAIFVTGAGSLFTLYQNAENERVKKEAILDTERKLIAEKIERLDLEIAYRLSATQSNLQAISVLPELRKDVATRKHIKDAVRPLFSPANEKVQPLFPEFSSYSGLALIAELRRHVNPSDKQRLSQVITSLSGLNGELDDPSKKHSTNATWVAGNIISAMGATLRWDLGFYYNDCSEERPFC